MRKMYTLILNKIRITSFDFGIDFHFQKECYWEWTTIECLAQVLSDIL